MKNFETKEIYLLWGATTTGKTSLSISLAHKYNAPVISLDRFQGCQEIKTGSGAPISRELKNTIRIYPCNGEESLVKGALSGSECYKLLKNIFSSYSYSYKNIILEGGSISLMKEIINDNIFWAGFMWNVKIFKTPEKHLFIDNAKKRIVDMFHPQDERNSILQEIISFYKNNKTLQPLEDIDGYRAIISYCNDRKINLDDLTKISSDAENEMISLIAEEYYTHALWQESETPKFPDLWNIKYI